MGLFNVRFFRTPWQDVLGALKQRDPALTDADKCPLSPAWTIGDFEHVDSSGDSRTKTLAGATVSLTSEDVKQLSLSWLRQHSEAAADSPAAWFDEIVTANEAATKTGETVGAVGKTVANLVDKAKTASENLDPKSWGAWSKVAIGVVALVAVVVGLKYVRDIRLLSR